MLKKFIFSLMAVMALSLVAIAQDGKPTSWTGSIVDKHCSAADMTTHGKGCVLDKKCLDSGLGLYTDGKFTPFDAKTSEQAKVALEKSKKDKGAKFKVTGTVVDGKIVAQNIQEVG
jgi:predicted outer membrane protein